VPADNKSWELYICCRKMTEIIFAPCVTTSQIAYLDLLVSEHHELLVNLAKEEVTPKCHFVTHYPRLMSVFGPLRHLWCMQFLSHYHAYHCRRNESGCIASHCTQLKVNCTYLSVSPDSSSGSLALYVASLRPVCCRH